MGLRWSSADMGGVASTGYKYKLDHPLATCTGDLHYFTCILPVLTLQRPGFSPSFARSWPGCRRRRCRRPSSAAILDSAVPSPPLMIAPAWPMRRPGGAVRPAMNATTGFFTCLLHERGGGFLVGAADLADHDDRHRSAASVANMLEQFDEIQPLDRIAADADAGGLPDAARAALPDGFVGQRSAAADDADLLAALGFPRACECSPA